MHCRRFHAAPRTRREMLRAGGLGMFGLGLADYFQLADLQAAPAHAAPKSIANF